LGRPEVQAAGGQYQVLAGLVRELPPQRLRLAGQPDVERIGVGAPEDPGAAVRAAAPVPGLERLQDRHRAPAAGYRPRRGRPGQPCSDDHHVHPVSAHGSTVSPADRLRRPVKAGIRRREEQVLEVLAPAVRKAFPRSLGAA